MYYLLYWGGAYADITFEPSCTLGDVSIDTIEVEGTTYHTVSVADFPLPMSGEYSAGLPSVPFTAQTFLLPPDIAIDTIIFISASWDTLPGRYYLYPAQSGSMEDTTFTLPNPEVYASDKPFPSQPVSVSRQGTAMGYSVASLAGTPIRYIPADSLLMVLTSVTLNIQTCTSEFERIVPVRETEWSSSIRERGILSLVSNPSDIRFYQQPPILSYRDRTSPLNILDSPSLEGDGVDMVIITSGPNGSGPDLTSAFQDLADYRTAQGIITIVRTVDWIDDLYSGCDIQEKIRNFIRDAHEQWGVQAVLLGGDDWIVPVRECWIPHNEYYHPADDYYADIDGDWKGFYNGTYYWQAPETDYYVDLILGRWPVDNSDHVQLLLSKLQLYECPAEFPTDFERKMLFIGGSAYPICEGKGAVYEEYLIHLLDEEDIIDPNGNLDSITELYFPQDGSYYCTPYGDDYGFESQEILSRPNALDELDAGYNLIIHFDHSGTHEIGAARYASPAEYIYDFDFQSLSNVGEPSILWTAGCWPGHFEGADCFAEAGLLTSDETGLVAVIANARSGGWSDWMVYYPFVDALYPFGWITEPDPAAVGGVLYIGEAYRYSMNFEHDIEGEEWGQTNYNKSFQNLFGDPSMFVWRNDSHQLAVETVPSIITAGISTDIIVSVTDEDEGNAPIAAKVCLYKDGDLFAIKYTNAVYGTVTFYDVEVAHTGGISVTAVRRQEIPSSVVPEVCNFIPAVTRIRVYDSFGALVNLEGFTIDDDNSGQSEGNGDGIANPGETIELDLDVRNLGMAGATRLRAQLSVVSGDVQIEDDYEFIGLLAGETSIEIQDAFVVSIPADLDENEPVQLEVAFIYAQGSWESPCDFTVLVDDIELPLHSVDAEFTDGVTTVDVYNILAVNTGIGAAEDVEITLGSFSHGAVFTTDVSIVGDIEPGTSVEAPSLSVSCINPPEEWQDPYNAIIKPGCSFEIIATDAYDREIYSEVIIVPNYDPEDRPQVPLTEYFVDVEAGQDYINVEWEGTEGFDGSYYLYVKENGAPTAWIRSNLLPIPVEQYSYSGLESSTVYELAVAAVDAYGQESPICEMENTASTVCTMLEGWPVQLEGSTGSGPIVTDIIGDDSPEIIAVTDFGNAYILSGDGQQAADLPSTTYRYTGCAVGNIDTDSQLEIIVACQVDITAGIAGIVIYDLDESSDIWHAELVCETGEIEESYETFGTPVLVQANASVPLEIALRTRSGGVLGYNYSMVHVWRWEASAQEWVEYSSAFPVTINGGKWYTTPPVSSDWDNDGNVELLVTSNNQSGDPCIFSIDIDQLATTVEFNMASALNASYFPHSSLAIVEWNGNHFVTGAAKGEYGRKKVFVVNLDTGNTVVGGHYVGGDFYGLMGGPAIGDFDGDGEPDFVFALNSMCAWDLSCNMFPDQGNLEHNPHDEDGRNIRSPSVFVGGSSPATLVGFSTKFYMHDVQDGMAVEEGFPSWTEDKAWAAPVVADIDEDGYLEVLAVDNSGYMCVFDWNGSGSISDGWPMFQHDRWRSGNYDMQLTDADGGKLDFDLLGVEEVIPERRLDENTSITLFAEVEVTGSGVPSPVITDVRATSVLISSSLNAVHVDNNLSIESSRTSEVQSQVRQTAANSVGYNYDTVGIALFSGNRELSSSEFPLYDGIHVIRLTIPETGFTSDDLVVRVDPDNEYPEAAEDNNARATGNLTDNTPSATRIFLQSPCESIVLNLDLLEAVYSGISIRAYSIDGRLVVEEELSELGSGSHILELSTHDILPSGLYTVVIEGINEEELIRRVVVLP